MYQYKFLLKNIYIYDSDKNDLFGQVLTDYTAQNPLEVQDAIEDLNGVALRNSAVKSRTF